MARIDTTMLHQLLIAGLLTLLTTAIHASCTAATLKTLRKLHAAHWAARSLAMRVGLISSIVIVMLSATVLEALLWALAYLWTGALDGFEPALYFSIVTFTTLGYGDVLLDEGWRLLASLQAATGIVMFGWTTALVLAVIQRMMALGGNKS